MMMPPHWKSFGFLPELHGAHVTIEEGSDLLPRVQLTALMTQRPIW
jgi:hypothetical protein